MVIKYSVVDLQMCQVHEPSHDPERVIEEFLGLILFSIKSVKNYDKSIVLNLNNVVKHKYILIENMYIGNYVMESRRVYFNDLLVFIDEFAFSYDQITEYKRMHEMIMKMDEKDIKREVKSEIKRREWQPAKPSKIPQQLPISTKYEISAEDQAKLDETKRKYDEKRKLDAEKAKEEEMRNIFECDKKIYYRFASEIKEGIKNETDISPLFIDKYNVFKILDQEGVEIDYPEYRDITLSLKDIEKYYEDKNLFFTLKNDLASNKRTIESIPEDYLDIYGVFSFMDDNNLLSQENEYDKFKDLLNQFSSPSGSSVSSS
jgi:hypothetical protein